MKDLKIQLLFENTRYILNMMYYTYILESIAHQELYIGYTNDLRRRFSEHNNGESKHTSKFRPWRIIYYEACLNKKDAERRELYFKTSQGRRLLRRRLKEYMYKKGK